MSEGNGMVYSTTGITSVAGEVSVNSHTGCIYFLNLHESTNATVKLNGGPHQIIIPPSAVSGGYVEVTGDYTKFEVITASVTIAVYALA